MILDKNARQQQNALTEHPLQPHKTADVTVKVDVEMLVSVTHGDDVIQLVVQMKSCDGNTNVRSNTGFFFYVTLNCILKMCH